MFADVKNSKTPNLHKKYLIKNHYKILQDNYKAEKKNSIKNCGVKQDTPLLSLPLERPIGLLFNYVRSYIYIHIRNIYSHYVAHSASPSVGRISVAIRGSNTVRRAVSFHYSISWSDECWSNRRIKKKAPWMVFSNRQTIEINIICDGASALFLRRSKL